MLRYKKQRHFTVRRVSNIVGLNETVTLVAKSKEDAVERASWHMRPISPSWLERYCTYRVEELT